MNVRFARWVVPAAMAASLSFFVAVSAQNAPYVSDIPKLFPALYVSWTKSLPSELGPLPDWLAKFLGVGSPIRDVSVGGAAMKFATTCKPHDCGDNIAGVLFSPQRNRIVALVRLSSNGPASSLLIVGPMTGAELTCTQRLIDEHDSTRC
jgi:hypothetical protein